MINCVKRHAKTEWCGSFILQFSFPTECGWRAYAPEGISSQQRKKLYLNYWYSLEVVFSAENLTKKVLTCLIESAVLLKIDTFGVKLWNLRSWTSFKNIFLKVSAYFGFFGWPLPSDFLSYCARTCAVTIEPSVLLQNTKAIDLRTWIMEWACSEMNRVGKEIIK